MSIWATWLAFGPGEELGETLRYEHSGVMPTAAEHLGGPYFEIAATPAEVEAERQGLDDEPVVDMVLPWLRVSLGGGSSGREDLRRLAALVYSFVTAERLEAVVDTVVALRKHRDLAARLFAIDAVLDRDQVGALHEALGVWLDRQKPERNQP